eukprot:6206064-Pleurochrysis_carterae.AAC.5
MLSSYFVSRFALVWSRAWFSSRLVPGSQFASCSVLTFVLTSPYACSRFAPDSPLPVCTSRNSRGPRPLPTPCPSSTHSSPVRLI